VYVRRKSPLEPVRDSFFGNKEVAVFWFSDEKKRAKVKVVFIRRKEN